MRQVAVLALSLALLQPWLIPAGTGGLGFIAPGHAQPAPLTKAQSDASVAYEKALNDFKAILAKRRAQIDARKMLPRLPGQEIYRARLKVMSTYKDLTDALPERIGRSNKFG